MTVSITNQRAVLVDSNGIVQNVIVWQDGDVAPEGFTVVVIDNAMAVSIGWVHNTDNTFTDPNPPAPVAEPPAPTLADLQAQLATLTAQIQALAGQNV
jgi:hypothetical protein